jgi:hypothetical protein
VNWTGTPTWQRYRSIAVTRCVTGSALASSMPLIEAEDVDVSHRQGE